jgi:hypothetical protein
MTRHLLDIAYHKSRVFPKVIGGIPDGFLSKPCKVRID